MGTRLLPAAQVRLVPEVAGAAMKTASQDRNHRRVTRVVKPIKAENERLRAELQRIADMYQGTKLADDIRAVLSKGEGGK